MIILRNSDGSFSAQLKIGRKVYIADHKNRDAAERICRNMAYGKRS